MSSKRVFRKLGLSVVAMMGLAAFMATGAQAVAGTYQVLNSSSLATGQTFAGTGGLGVLLVATLNVEIHCAGFSASGNIPNGPAGIALVKVLFENCVAKSITPLEPLASCIIANGGANHHITATAIVLSVLHNGVKYLLAESDEGAPFATIEWVKEMGCTLPTTTITGTYAFETSQNQVIAPLVLAGNEALQTLLGDELKFGKNKAIIDQAAANDGTVSLTGTDKGCTWGAV